MTTIKKGSKEPEVAYLQALLGLTVDGVFGENTEKEVIKFQEKYNLKNDGIVGPGTWKKLEEVYPRTVITENDYKKVAEYLDCDVASVKAIKEVESGKSPFLDSGYPTMLFEAHIFYKELGEITARKLQPLHPGIISKTWNRNLYKGGEKEVTRLEEAWKISPKAAAASASYGAFQICGFNYKNCGYPGAIEFLGDIWKGELQQLNSFANFIKNTGIAKYLKAHDWTEVARRYNGPGYEANSYDRKLSAAYKKFGGK